MNINNRLQILCFLSFLFLFGCGQQRQENVTLSCPATTESINVMDVKISGKCYAYSVPMQDGSIGQIEPKIVITYSNNSNVPVAISINGSSTRLEAGQSNSTTVEFDDNNNKGNKSNYKVELQLRTLPR